MDRIIHSQPARISPPLSPLGGYAQHQSVQDPRLSISSTPIAGTFQPAEPRDWDAASTLEIINLLLRRAWPHALRRASNWVNSLDIEDAESRRALYNALKGVVAHQIDLNQLRLSYDLLTQKACRVARTTGSTPPEDERMKRVLHVARRVELQIALNTYEVGQVWRQQVCVRLGYAVGDARAYNKVAEVLDPLYLYQQAIKGLYDHLRQEILMSQEDALSLQTAQNVYGAASEPAWTRFKALAAPVQLDLAHDGSGALLEIFRGVVRLCLLYTSACNHPAMFALGALVAVCFSSTQTAFQKGRQLATKLSAQNEDGSGWSKALKQLQHVDGDETQHRTPFFQSLTVYTRSPWRQLEVRALYHRLADRRKVVKASLLEGSAVISLWTRVGPVTAAYTAYAYVKTVAHEIGGVAGVGIHYLQTKGWKVAAQEAVSYAWSGAWSLAGKAFKKLSG